MNEVESRDNLLLEEAIRKLKPYFDSVQIFCTRHEEEKFGGTISVHAGKGNLFSRIGLVRAWLINEDRKGFNE